MTNQNFIQEKIKCRLKGGNSCYYSVQTLCLLDFSLKICKIKIHKTIILLVLLYGCEAWSLTLKEECRLRVFDNRILRQIFGPKRDEKGEWRRLHNEELHCLYRSPNIVRQNVDRIEEGRNPFKILTDKPTGKRTLGRPRRRGKDNIRMDHKEIRGIGLIWLRIRIIGEPL